MFIGHYGVSFAAKRFTPRTSLGVLVLAVQLLDVLFAVFVLAGVEKMRIVPGFTEYNASCISRGTGDAQHRTMDLAACANAQAVGPRSHGCVRKSSRRPDGDDAV